MLRSALAALFIGIAIPAAANCGGTDLRPGLAASDPGFAEQIAAGSVGVVNAEGRFYRIDREGLAPSYILGTYHDSEAGERGISEAMLDALAASERLLVEITSAEQTAMMGRMMANPEIAFDFTIPPLQDRIDPELVPLLEELLADRGLNIAMVGNMRPWMLISVFAIPACELRAVTRGALVMDAQIEAVAEAEGLEVIGLETIDEALKAFDRMTLDDIDAIIEDTLATHGEIGEEDVRRTTINLYLEGRIYDIWTLGVIMSERLPGDKESRRQALALMWSDVMVARNRKWEPRIMEELARGGAFIAVGALHLPTDDGLIAVIEGAGYTVTRLD